MKKLLDEDTTYVVADFDGTLIKKVVDGKKIPSLMSILTNEANFGSEGLAEIRTLISHYYPIELDHSLTAEEKCKDMQEWWEKSYDILRKYHITSKMIEDTCHSPMVQLRTGLSDFMAFLERHSIPMIIYSASAIGYDSIGKLLCEKQLLTPNVSICSNDIIFDSEGYFQEVKQPIIHAANKTGKTLIENGYIDQHPNRQHCLLIGDSLDDIQMTNGIHFEKVTKVAFADTSAPKFAELFDIVLPIDGGFDHIIQLFQ